MQDTVLLSIRPEFAEKILRGDKKYEYRRTRFRSDTVKRVLVYATSPTCRVVGEFEIEAVLSMPKLALWKSTRHSSGICWTRFSEYFGQNNRCHALKVGNPVRYAVPRMLEEVSGLRHPPQSFAYVKGAAMDDNKTLEQSARPCRVPC
jgi:predicted transcriptional regulator